MVVARSWEIGGWKWGDVGRFSVIRRVGSEDPMRGMVTPVTNTVLYAGKLLRVDFKHSQHRHTHTKWAMLTM